MPHLFKCSLILAIGICLGATLRCEEKKPPQKELLRPQHPRVQEAIKRTLPLLKNGISSTINFQTNRDPTKKNELGYTLLNILALVEGRRCLGVKRPYLDPDIKEYIEDLAKTPRRNLEDTYIAGISSMLLAGYVKDYKKAEPKGKDPLAKSCLDLLERISKGWARSITQEGSWGYSSMHLNSRAGNHSTAQYAVLSLESAKSCGIPIPKGILGRAAQAFLNSQNADGGWGYMPSTESLRTRTKFTNSSYIAMTAVGMATLHLSRAEIEEVTANRALKMANDYLVKHYDPKKLPCLGDTNAFWAYSMYSVERAGMLMNTDTFGDVDWYDRGARMILTCQKPNGDFVVPGPYPGDNAFCILFLAKGSASIRNYSVEELLLSDLPSGSVTADAPVIPAPN